MIQILLSPYCILAVIGLFAAVTILLQLLWLRWTNPSRFYLSSSQFLNAENIDVGPIRVFFPSFCCFLSAFKDRHRVLFLRLRILFFVLLWCSLLIYFGRRWTFMAFVCYFFILFTFTYDLFTNFFTMESPLSHSCKYLLCRNFDSLTVDTDGLLTFEKNGAVVCQVPALVDKAVIQHPDAGVNVLIGFGCVGKKYAVVIPANLSEEADINL